MHKRVSSISLLLALSIQGGLSYADEPAQADSLLDAVIDGKPLVHLRLRYEHDDQENKSHNANAFTLRSLVGWETKSFNNFSLHAEAIDVAKLNDAYDDLSRGHNQNSKGNYRWWSIPIT